MRAFNCFVPALDQQRVTIEYRARVSIMALEDTLLSRVKINNQAGANSGTNYRFCPLF